MRSRRKSYACIYAVANDPNVRFTPDEIWEIATEEFPEKTFSSIKELDVNELDLLASKLVSFRRMNLRYKLNGNILQDIKNLDEPEETGKYEVKMATKAKTEKLTGTINSATLRKMTPAERKELKTREIDAVAEQIRSITGEEDSITSLGSGPSNIDPDSVISTGYLGLDISLRTGGIPKGRMTVIPGEEGSGKTTLALSIAAEHTKQGLPVIYFDSENAISDEWVLKFGVDPDLFKLVTTQKLEELGDFLTRVNRNTEEYLFVIDSLPSFFTKEEEYEEDDPKYDKNTKIASQATLWGKILRQNLDALRKNNNTIIGVNHKRANMNRANKYSPEFIDWGTKQIAYYTSTRIDLKPLQKTFDKNNEALSGFRGIIPKNKSAGMPNVPFIFGIYKGEKLTKAQDIVINSADFLPELNDKFLRTKTKYDEKEGEVKPINRLNMNLLLFSDEAIEVILEDEPLFLEDNEVHQVSLPFAKIAPEAIDHYGLARVKPDHLYVEPENTHVMNFNTSTKGSLEAWLESHPRYLAYMYDEIKKTAINKTTQLIWQAEDQNLGYKTLESCLEELEKDKERDAIINKSIASITEDTGLEV